MRRISLGLACFTTLLVVSSAAQAQSAATCIYDTEVRTSGTTGFVRYVSPDTFTLHRRGLTRPVGPVYRCHENERQAGFGTGGTTLYDYANLPGGGLAALTSSFQSETTLVLTVYEPDGQRRASFGTDGRLPLGTGRAAFGVTAEGPVVLTTILPQPDGGLLLTGLPQGTRRYSARGDSLTLTRADSLTYLCPTPATGTPAPAARVLPHDSERFGRGDARFLVACAATVRRFTAPGVLDVSFGSGGAVTLPEGWTLPLIYHDATQRYYGGAALTLGLRATALYALGDDGRLAPDFGARGTLALPDTLTYMREGASTPERSRTGGYRWLLLDDGSVLVSTNALASPFFSVGTIARVTPSGMFDAAFAEAYGPRRVVEPGFTAGSGALPDVLVVLPGGRLVTTYTYPCNTVSSPFDQCYRTHTLAGLPTATSSEAGPRAPGAGLTLVLAGPHPVRAGAVARFAVSGADTGAALVVDLVDALGRRVAGAASVSGDAVTVETAGLSAGVYAVRAVSGAAHATRVFIVVR